MSVPDDGGRSERLLARRSGGQRETDVLHIGLLAENQQGKCFMRNVFAECNTFFFTGYPDIPDGPPRFGRISIRS